MPWVVFELKLEAIAVRQLLAIEAGQIASAQGDPAIRPIIDDLHDAAND